MGYYIGSFVLLFMAGAQFAVIIQDVNDVFPPWLKWLLVSVVIPFAGYVMKYLKERMEKKEDELKAAYEAMQADKDRQIEEERKDKEYWRSVAMNMPPTPPHR